MYRNEFAPGEAQSAVRAVQALSRVWIKVDGKLVAQWTAPNAINSKTA
jgi:hypothetical protein